MDRLSISDDIVIIDNYDSFTYNTVQLLGQLGAACRVVLNDQVSTSDIAALRPRGLLLSAGPGTPDDAGVTLAAIAQFAGRIPILGVCLGHQAIAQAFGGRVVGGGRLMHGKASQIEHDGSGLFRGLPRPAVMARYNSLLVDEASLPPLFAGHRPLEREGNHGIGPRRVAHSGCPIPSRIDLERKRRQAARELVRATMTGVVVTGSHTPQPRSPQPVTAPVPEEQSMAAQS